MARVDLHVHSKYSNHPTEWFLKRIGTSESYTEPEFIYSTAKAQGMDFVTITDHNSIEGALRLHEAHPQDTFLGVESTTYFPEDHCKVHLLIYDFTEWQFHEIQGLRKNIYELRDGQCSAGGRYHDFSSMAFSIFKIAYEFAKSKKSNFASVPLRLVTDLVFNNRKLSLFEDLAINFLGRRKTVKEKTVRRLYGDLVRELKSASESKIEEKLDILYAKVAALSDSLISDLITRTEKSIMNGKLEGLARTLTAALPMVFLTVPFFSTFANMNNNRNLIEKVRTGLGWKPERKRKRILWFTDTMCDLNGVATSLAEIGHLAWRYDMPIMIATSLPENANPDKLPPNVMTLPLVASIPIPEYENISLRIPSLLHTLKMVQQFDPDEIYISSPALVGLVGLLIAKLMKVKAVGIYHTDFTLQAAKVIDDTTVTRYLEEYMKWFYGSCDRVLSNTRGYIEILKERGYDVSNMEVFERGIDTEVFKPVPGAAKLANKLWKIGATPFVLYAGRVSKDKSVDLLINSFLAGAEEGMDLVIAGDGPDLEKLKHRYRSEANIKFLGRVGHEQMPILFTAAFIFAFPSTTDTFGRVVLEALACGTPALVSAVGGPQELIQPGATGRVVMTQTVSAWSNEIWDLKHEIDSDYEGAIAANARAFVLNHYGIAKYFEQILPEPESVERRDARLVPA